MHPVHNYKEKPCQQELPNTPISDWLSSPKAAAKNSSATSGKQMLSRGGLDAIQKVKETDIKAGEQIRHVVILGWMWNMAS
jgi:hypothetical protein